MAGLRCGLPPRPRSAAHGGSQACLGRSLQTRPRLAATESSEIPRGLRLRLGRSPKADGSNACTASFVEQQVQSLSVASASTQATDQCGLADFCASQSTSSITPTHDVVGELSFCGPSARPHFSSSTSEADLASAASPPRILVASSLTQRRPRSTTAYSQPSRRSSISPRADSDISATPAPLQEETNIPHEDVSSAKSIPNARDLASAQRSMSTSSLRHPCEEGGVLAGKYGAVRFLGRGTSASVWEAVDNATGDKFAIKVFDKSKSDWTSHQKHAIREARLLQNLTHPAIVKVHETIDTQKSFHIVLELVIGGSLRELVRNRQSTGLGEQHSRMLFQQICDGVCHLHSRSYVHRDLKLENILVEAETGHAKIIDFGFALVLRSREQRLRVFCGTPSYMAPELVMNQEYSGFCTDVWALGVVLFGMLAGRLPFEGQTQSQLYAKIRRGQFRFPEGVPDLARRLVSGILRIDATARPTAAQVLQHRWVTSEAVEHAGDAGKSSTGLLADSTQSRPSSVPAATRRLRTTHERSLRLGN